MTANPQPPPEARLIAERRDAIVPRLSMRHAAQRMGIPFSAARWRQLESGVRRVATTDFPETGPAETIARMARVVGITPAELTQCGRLDAAQILATLAAPEPELTAASYEDLTRRLSRLEDMLERALADREHRDKEDDTNDRKANGSRRAG